MNRESSSSSSSLILGRYRVVQQLARGGMGAVYLGRVEGAAGFSKPVVIKRVLSHLAAPDGRKQFVREARLLSALQHPNIVGVIDFGEWNGDYQMVLEYVHGYHAGRWLLYHKKKGRELSWTHAVLIVLSVLDALAYAHGQKGLDGEIHPIVHRDVSPSNILVDQQGNVRLLDFGIARQARSEDSRTRSGVVRGKLHFIAPELFSGSPATPLSDVYSTGVVLHLLLAGSNPFKGSDVGTVMHSVKFDAPPPLEAFRDDLPDGLPAVVRKALEKDPSQRFVSAARMSEALRKLLPVSETQLREEFRRAVERDFFGDLPEVLGVESLQSLERAWRMTVSGTGLSSSTPPGMRPDVQRDSGHPTIPDPSLGRKRPDSGIEDMSPSSGQTRVIVGSIVAAALVAGAVALATVTFSKPPGEEGQRFMIVAKNSTESPFPSPTASPPAEPSTDPAPAAVDPPPPPSSLAPRPEMASGKASLMALTRPFAARQGEIQNCFNEHASAQAAAPTMNLRFTLSPVGETASVSVSPASLAASPLGSCVLRIARSTRFPNQGRAISFSIPLSARSVQ